MDEEEKETHHRQAYSLGRLRSVMPPSKIAESSFDGIRN